LFLESFRSIVRVGYARQGGTFHPKLYLFENAGRYCCVIGSSNFTGGGFANNTELNIRIEGQTSDLFLRQVREFIDTEEKHSPPISLSAIDDYREQFEHFKATRAKLEKFRSSKTEQAEAKARKSRKTAGEEPPERLDRRQFDAFASEYQRKGVAMGTASRLLSMKRPDLFVCVDSKNRPGIARAFGVTVSSLQTFEGYWDLMQRIWRCPWWRAPRPGRALQ
jgi:hypothetical protein